MKFGFGLPPTTKGDELCRFAQRTEELGFELLWSADHIVLPAAGTSQYPYTEDGSFFRPSSEPILETMTVLSYIASCTKKIRIGSTILVLPYRNPVVQAKMFASLDVLTGGRVICGVGVGWMEKEFETLQVPFSERGPMSDEYLAIFKCLWTQENPEFHGRFYSFDGIQFYPKPVQKPHIPIWVGGHSRRAIRRAIAYGDAWHTSRHTPEWVASQLPYLRQQAEAAGRDPKEIGISLKRTLQFADLGIPFTDAVRTGGLLTGTAQQVIDDVRRSEDLGIDLLTYDFRVGDVEHHIRALEHFAEKVVPAV